MEDLLLSQYLTHLLLRVQHAELDLREARQQGRAGEGQAAQARKATGELYLALKRLTERGKTVLIHSTRGGEHGDLVRRVGEMTAVCMTYSQFADREPCSSRCDLLQADRIEVPV